MHFYTKKIIVFLVGLILSNFPNTQAQEEAITFSGKGDGPIEIIDEKGHTEVQDTESNERMSYATNWGKASPIPQRQRQSEKKQVTYVPKKNTKEQEITINTMLKKRRVALRKPFPKNPPKKRK